MKIHTFELRKKEWILKSEGSSQLYTQLMQLQRKPEKNSGLNGIRTHDIYDIGAVLYHILYILFNFNSSPQRVYNEFTQWPAPSWLDSSIGRSVHRYRKVMGSNPVQAWICFRLSFRDCLSCIYNFDDHPIIHFLLSVAAWINLNAVSFNSFNSSGQKSHERRKRRHGEYWTTETWRHQGTNGWSAGKKVANVMEKLDDKQGSWITDSSIGWFINRTGTLTTVRASMTPIIVEIDSRPDYSARSRALKLRSRFVAKSA